MTPKREISALWVVAGIVVAFVVVRGLFYYGFL